MIQTWEVMYFTKSNTFLSWRLKFVGVQAYSYQEVVAATENFKKEIGKGGFGPVFYGKLNNRQEVAIKVLDIASRQGSAEFYNEVCLQSCFEMLYI